MADGLFGVGWDQSLELRLGPLMVQMGATGFPVERREFRPSVGGIHVHNPDGLDAGFCGLAVVGDRWFTGPDGVPERLLYGD